MFFFFFSQSVSSRLVERGMLLCKGWLLRPSPLWELLAVRASKMLFEVIYPLESFLPSSRTSFVWTGVQRRRLLKGPTMDRVDVP